MHRIGTSTAKTDKHGSGKDGFTDGDPSTGEATTKLEDDWFDMVQEELCTVVERDGGTVRTKAGDASASAYDQLDLASGARLACGDGDDGAVTTAGNATLTADVVCTTYTLTAGDTITADGFRIFATEEIIINGTIEANGSAAAAGVGGSGAGANVTGSGEDGGNGGSPVDGNGQDGDDTPLNQYGIGGDGADGGSAGGSAGDAGTVTSPAATMGTWRIYPWCLGIIPQVGGTTDMLRLRGGAGGGGGAADALSVGGGGGGGGGIVVLVAPRITVGDSGSIEAKGGDGADSSGNNAAGGGGGGGGAVVLVTRTPAADLAADIDVSGGTGGSGTGTGDDGGDGDDGSTLVVRL